MIMGKEDIVVTDTVETVLSSGLVRLDRSVRTRLCALIKCEAIKVDMMSPKDWLKWVCRVVALYESPKNSCGCVVRQMKCALPNMLCGTLVLRTDSSQILAFGLSLKIRSD